MARDSDHVSQGEFDAMSVYQATGVPAVSLPNGASSLPLEVLPLLERFDKLYLWMDHDGPGQTAVDKFVKKLVRCQVFINFTVNLCSENVSS